MSGYCRATPFDAQQTRCLTPCSRATAADCHAQGLPGICVETGDDAALLCAGGHVFGDDTAENKTVLPNTPNKYSAYADVGDADLFMLNLANVANPIAGRVHTNAGEAVLTATWLNARGEQIKTNLIPKNSFGYSLLSTPGYYFVIVGHSSGGKNGYHVSAQDD